MNRLPLHNSAQFSDIGIVLRRIDPNGDGIAQITYAHQDDYYIFGILESGSGCGVIDLMEHHITAGDIFIVQPGQVHRFIDSENAEGWLLFADSKHVGNIEKCIFDRFSLFASSFKIDAKREGELTQIAAILADRMSGNLDDDKLSRITATRLTETFISIIAEAIQSIDMQYLRFSQRHIDIVLSLRHLLAEHLATSRQPSYYASRLNISTVYLNEVVKKVTGMNSTIFIKNEVVLRAKRMLVHSHLSIKEISIKLGFDDSAYFSRMFTSSTGISPTSFRQKYLE